MSSVTLEETDSDLPVSVQESPAEVWVSSDLLQEEDTECGSACMESFKGQHCYLYYLQDSLASGQNIGKEHNSSHQQKIRLKIY